MTSETYLDLTFDRSAKSGKRPIRPKLLKLTDVTMPHRNRKKTKVKSKDRAASSVRDRIYDDPAYTDDISHLANPTRRSSCSSKGEGKGAHGAANTSLGGSSSLGKRSKLTKEFLQYAKQGKGRSGGGATLTAAGVGSYENDGSSSSDEPQRSEAVKGGVSMGRRGRSLERSMASSEAKSEKKREKRERNNKQKRNLSLDNSLQQQEIALRALDQLDMHSIDQRAPRSKEARKSQLGVPKQYSDGGAELQWSEEHAGRHLPPTPADERDELFSVHSSSVSNAAISKMQIGRRFLRGEIGIKSFNYYLLKEGLKSSKKFVEKQRNSLTGGLGGASGKKLHSRSEENIYEEIFFKDAPPSDEENQNQVVTAQLPSQQHQKHHMPQQQQAPHAGMGADTPLSQCSASDGVYADCELCMQQCTKENCEYCYVAQAGVPLGDSRVGSAVRPLAAVQHQQPQLLHGKLQKQQFDSLGRQYVTDGPRAATTAGGAYINQAQIAALSATTGSNDTNNGNNLSGAGGGGGSAPTAHILEFQSYNPNNPGVYKIETTPVAITGEYNPILQFQQSSPSTTTTTTTTPSDQLQQQHQHHQLLHHQAHLQQQQHVQHIQQYTHQQQPLPPPPTQQQQQQQHQQQYKSLAQGYVLQAGTAVPLTAAALTNSHYQRPGGPAAGGSGAGGGVLPLRTRGQRGHQQHQHQQQQQHYIVSYNGAPLAATTTSAGASASASMQRMNTKSSSSSDSLQQQQLHKYNTMARLEAHNVLVSDPFYGGGGNIGAGVAGTPLMYAASRPIGGSQILVDSYELPQMYKSDSRASILSEYSLRSSDNSHRYNHRYRYGGAGGSGGRGEISDSSLGDSLLSYNSAHRRYFGSSESCRFAFECRRCSLDGGEKCSYSDTCRYECRNCDCSSSYFSSDFDEMYGSMPRSSGIPRKTAAGTLPANVTSEYERQQEQLDLKQNKYAQDFFKHVNDVKRSIYQSEMHRNGGGGDGGSMNTPKTVATASDQSGGKSKSKYSDERSGGSPRRSASKEQQPSSVPPACATLPLTKERARQHGNDAISAITGRAISTDSGTTPTPAPRTSLQQTCNLLPQPTQRRAPSAYERHEYPSLDRLVASATGAIPKTTTATTSTAALANSQIGSNGGKQQLSTKNNATNTMENNKNNNNSNTRSPHHSPKTSKAARSAERAHRADGAAAAEDATGQARVSRSHHYKGTSDAPDEQPAKRERYLNVASAGAEAAAVGGNRRHHRSSSSSKQAGAAAATPALTSSMRRSKDVPAPPPPSPATYSDLQELKANLGCVQQDAQTVATAGGKTQQKTKKHSRREAATANEACEQQQKIEQQKQQMAGGQPNVAQTLPKPAATATATTTKDVKNKSNSRGSVTTTATTTTTATKTAKETAAEAGEKAAAVTAVTGEQGVGSAVGVAHVTAHKQEQQQAHRAEDAPKKASQEQQQATRTTPTTATTEVTEMPERSENNNSNNVATDASTQKVADVTGNNNTHSDANDDDDVFYDARSEDSAGTAASAASSGVLLHTPERRQRRREAQSPVEGTQQQQQQKRQRQTSPQLQQQQQQQQRVSSSKAPQNDQKPCERLIKDTSAGPLKDSAEAENANNEVKKTSKKLHSDAQLLNVAESGQGAKATAAAEAMALNLAEAAIIHTTTTTPTATATPPTPTTTTPTAADQKDSSIAVAAATTPTRKEKKHERRSSRQSGGGGSNHASRQQQPKTAAITLTISCDTCCQLECEQQQLQEQQQQLQQQKSNETRAKQQSKRNEERASKIKEENDNNNTTVERTGGERLATTTTTTTTVISATTATEPASTPTTCAATLLPATNAANVAAAAVPALAAAATAADTCHKYDTQSTTATTTATEPGTGAEIGAQAASNNKMSASTAATCSGVDGKTSLTTTPTTTTATAAAAATTTTAAAAAPAVDTIPVVAAAVDNGSCNASAANSTVSCNSDGAGVATVSHSSSSNVPTRVAVESQDKQQQQQQQQLIKRAPLYRQEHSTCVDSSEPQSDDSHLTRDSITRESQNDELSSSTHDKIDVSTLPLPALPPKKRRTRLRASPSRYHSRRHEHELPLHASDEVKITAAAQQSLNVIGGTGGGDGSGGSGVESPHLSAFQQYVAKRRESLEASSRHFNEKLEARRMHYHMGGAGGGSASSNVHMPTYLFGEHYYGVPASGRKAPGNKEEIFLNKSGWVQVNTKRTNDENRGSSGNYRRANYAHQNGGGSSGGGGTDLHNTIRVIQIDNTRRSDMARQALLQHQHSVDPTTGMPVYNISKYPSSKVEELIQRNEARLNTATNQSSAGGARDNALRPGYRIVDPQLANILNERPGFLPVKNLHDADSPPPITPILSPPPAFQDSSKSKYFDRRKTIPTRQQAHQSAAAAVAAAAVINTNSLHTSNGGAGKGMVFSRSFEYDTRRNTPADTYMETFSRSFDGNLSERHPLPRERSPNFSTLTGNSPNYLSKKDSGGGSSGSLRSRDSSPKYQQPQTTAYLNTSIKEAPPAYSLASNNTASQQRYSPRARHERSFERSKSHNVLVRSRKSQFNRVASSGPVMGVGAPPTSGMPMGMSRFRSFDTTMSQRLNSCDSGARSDLSNDELDCDDDEGSSEFLTTTNYHHSISPLKTQRQRSLTPDRNESHSSSNSLRKQRSLTPESRSLTPEDRRKKNGSQASLMGSRQNSSSRSNTLERKQRLEEKSAANISRSSSSSSYSGREHDAHPAGHLGGGTAGSRSQHRRSLGRNAKQADEHRIRRSRSLQLSERSPNRTHKMIVSVGQAHPPAPPPSAPVYQQANMRSNISNGAGNFPPTIRTSGKSQSILLSSGGGSMQNGGSSGGRVRNSDIDKSRSFDFDYCNYNNTIGATTAKGHGGGSGGVGSNQNVPMRLDFDKSRSFDDDYREPINSNNNLGGANGMRYLQTEVIPSGGSTGRLRRTSPVAVGGGSGGERNSRSPQSSGSSCNNLNLPRQSTSPQNYGTRLCDHELTYDMLRKSLDRSPIMDFRRGDSSDYDLPPAVTRNRETINAGGNSELNFFSSDAHIYEQPTTTITTSASSAGIKQQRSLGHTQSPSESQYSLERLHSSRDSITPDGGGSEYRGDYIYRQTQSAAQRENARGSSRGSSQKIPTTTTPPTKATTARTRKCPIPKATSTKSTVKSPRSTFCSFWPHCGACNTRSATSTNTSAIKRQSSLQNATNTPAKCQNLRNGAARPCGLPLRRNHSAHLPAERERDFHDVSRNVSTVSVNGLVKSMRSDNDVGVGGEIDIVGRMPTLPSNQRSKSQWTLLCSGATPTNATETSATVTAHALTPSRDNSRINVAANVNVALQAPRDIPLAATSLVFLGDCEMPITRERDNAYERERERERERQRERNAKRTTSREGVVKAAAERGRRNAAAAVDAKNHNDYSRNDSTVSKPHNGRRPPASSTIYTVSTATTKSSGSVATATQCGHSTYLCSGRSRSLPDIPHANGLTNADTASDGPHGVGARSSFSTSLSHQVRAVSSPSLTDAIQQEAVQATSMQLALTSATSSASGESTPTAPTSSNNSASLPTSQSVGVLQKFKRTLTNFNKTPQQQQQTQQQSASAVNAAATNKAHPHAAAPLVTAAPTPAFAAVAAPVGDGQHDAAATSTTSSTLDAGAASKYRFGPLIWRSSKERRKTKYNRRDKCNSGDSGIQIELENDEQFSRMLTTAGGAAAAAAAAAGGTAAGSGNIAIVLGRAAEEMLATPKLRSVRRTNSAKASSITDHTTTAMSAKAKILKRMEMCGSGEKEREAPESLPTRSLSQPNGLETFGIGRADLDDSDSDSVASHDEGPNYYPIYAEVLYSFTAAGPQELGLERGTLIEILRKEVGPWWFGRIKKEESTLVEEILDPELGWFPKEFVRVIQCPETDTFFLSQIPNATAADALSAPAVSAATKFDIAVASMPTATPRAPNSATSDTADTVVDENNVTTIVIESPSYNAISQSNSNGTSGNDCNALAPSRSINVILDSADVLQRSAVKELLDTEVNYVKLLASICEGYLPAMSKRIDIFSPNSIRLIFSNIIAIYKFQRKFLEALRKGIEQNQIAKVFLKMHKGFLCYSTYCNAYPRALIELESYDRVKDAKIILDNCRESENLAELPLSAHLLAPVQRICRYPLHLAEIIKSAAKSTEAPAHELAQFEQLDVSQLDIPDTRETIDMALEAMKSITEAVNEGKRHSETIARHQASFQNFKGPPLHLHSTRFFLQIDATRQKQNLWNSSCTLFLFDNQLIYCKRDIIKRSQFIYKGRIFLDRCRVVNVRDGKMFGHTIKNSLRIYCEARDKWYDFSFRSANRKHRFLSTLALERQFGGKALYVSEMTGFEYAFEERDYSDQSDYEMPESENSIGIGGLAVGQRHWSMADVTTNGTSASGDSSVPESPVKYKYSDTLPKKSQTREPTNGGGGSGGTLSAGECQTGSLGRRRLGNWFRKPKSSNSTPNHSPTHKPPHPGTEQQAPSSEQAGGGDGVSGSHEAVGTTTIDLSSSSST